jgi:hypothetical protein
MPDHFTESIAPSAPIESKVSVVQEWTDMFTLTPTGSGWVTLETVLSPYLEGCGSVDLVELEVVFYPRATGSAVLVGVREIGSAKTIKDAAMSGGVYTGGNNMNLNQKQIAKLIIPGNLSMQIRPPSAQLPQMVLGFKMNGECDVVLIFRVKVNGFRQRYGETTFA